MSPLTESSLSLSRTRIYIVAGLLVMGLSLLLFKAARLQLGLGGDLKALAERQYLRQLKFRAPRGNIYDKDGRPLAISVPVWSIAAAPHRIEDREAVKQALRNVLPLEASTLDKKLAPGRRFVWLARRVTPEVADAVRALKLEGIELHKESKRFYPNRALAGQLLGTVSIDGSGQSGVERAQDEHLRGRTVRLPGLRDNHGQKAVLTEGFDLEVLSGDDVYLTVDAGLQHVVEATLAHAVKELSANYGAAVVVDPRTGDIRALASAPLYNPNAPRNNETGAMRNQAISATFEPGSTFKMVTFAAALDEGVVTPQFRVFCENGKAELGRFTVRDTHPEGWLTVRDVFKFSSNIGAMKIGEKLGEQKFREVIDRFGFGHSTGLGLIGESAGRLPDGRWGEVRSATASFGHGLTVTALQMAQALSGVANGGEMWPLRIVRKVVSPTGEIVAQPATDGPRRVIKAQTARVLGDIMSSVFEQGGTAPQARIEGITAAGKTGTAEKVDPVTKRYSKKLHVASFIGFAPVDNPAVAAVVVIDEPHGSTFGGSAAGPVWRDIVSAALVKEGLLIQDERALDEPKVAAPAGPAPDDGEELLGLSARDVIRRAERAGAEVVFEGTGMVRQVERTTDEDKPPRWRVKLGAK